MGAMAKIVMQRFYRQADGSPEQLPWYRDSPDTMLIDAVAARQGHDRALDVGCGAGTFAVWLAEQGMDVTGIDLFPEAIAMARSLADQRKVVIELACIDLFTYRPDQTFDLVYDSGCLHSLVGGDVASYKRQLLRWLSPGGDYVLDHWTKRNRLDWRPIGPKRRSETTIRRIFAPELRLVDSVTVDFAVPLPFGPTVRGAGYRFNRPPQTDQS